MNTKMTRNFPPKLTVAALDFKSFFEFPKKNQTEPGGIDGRLLETLSDILGFQYHLTSPSDDEFGRLKDDGNWSGLIGMVSSGQADIALTYTAITEERTTVVDFTLPYIISDVTYVTKLPGTVPRAYTYLHSFDVPIWIGIAVLLLVMPFVFYLHSDPKLSYSDAFFMVFANIFSKPTQYRLPKGRTLMMSWWFSSFILSSCFAARISTLLFMPLRGTPIRTFEELSRAIGRSEWKLVAWRGSSHSARLSQTGTDYLVSIGEAMQNNDWYLEHGLNLRLELDEKQIAFIDGRLYMNLNFGIPPSSTYFIPDDGCFNMLTGIVVSKDFCCKSSLNYVLTKLREMGVMSKYITDEIHRSMLSFQRDNNNMVSGLDSIRSLGLSDLSGAFAVLLVGYLLASVTLFAEIMCSRI